MAIGLATQHNRVVDSTAALPCSSVQASRHALRRIGAALFGPAPCTAHELLAPLKLAEALVPAAEAGLLHAHRVRIRLPPLCCLVLWILSPSPDLVTSHACIPFSLVLSRKVHPFHVSLLEKASLLRRSLLHRLPAPRTHATIHPSRSVSPCWGPSWPQLVALLLPHGAAQPSARAHSAPPFINNASQRLIIHAFLMP